MKKLLISLLLTALGAGSWWVVARSARFNIKNWDAKFETVMRHNITAIGLTDQDVISSFHEIRKDNRGEWVTHRMSLKMVSPEKQNELAREFEDAGARVEQHMENDLPVLVVKRGPRIYQEIHFVR